MLDSHGELYLAERLCRVDLLDEGCHRLGRDVARQDLLIVACEGQLAVKRSVIALFLLDADLDLELITTTVDNLYF